MTGFVCRQGKAPCLALLAILLIAGATAGHAAEAAPVTVKPGEYTYREAVERGIANPAEFSRPDMSAA